MNDKVFEDARRGISAVGPSADDQELVVLLERHGAEEGAVLERYQQLAAHETSGAVRYLIDLIMDDERRHHRVIEEMANAIAWGGLAGPQIPTVPDVTHNAGSPELLAATRELLAVERRDAEELKGLRRKLKPYADTTLWALLVEMMLLDTEKHSRILEFLERHVANA